MNRDQGVEYLLDEIRRRVTRLERDGARLRSVGRVRELVEQAFEAGVAMGRMQQLADGAFELQSLLDEATAAMPDALPDGVASNDPHVAYWRNGRQHLWHLVERRRGAMVLAHGTEQTRAAKRRSWVEQRCGELLAPVPPLRVRVGRWLLDGAEWIDGIGKLRGAVRS